MDESNRFFTNLPSGISVLGSVKLRLLAEYGAMFLAKGVSIPSAIVFQNEEDVTSFQLGSEIASEQIGSWQMELQSQAMDSLRSAIGEAEHAGLTISPRGADSARRSYQDTVELWTSRVEPALRHWVANYRITQNESDRIEAMSPFEQVPEILELEENGIFFSKDLSKSIIYSVAPPGTSQHLSMLAFDVNEFDDPEVRQILASHRWYQTVVSDLPHFTYLGVEESGLSDLGLKMVSNGGRTFWLPDI